MGRKEIFVFSEKTGVANLVERRIDMTEELRAQLMGVKLTKKEKLNTITVELQYE